MDRWKASRHPHYGADMISFDDLQAGDIIMRSEIALLVVEKNDDNMIVYWISSVSGGRTRFGNWSKEHFDFNQGEHSGTVYYYDSFERL